MKTIYKKVLSLALAVALFASTIQIPVASATGTSADIATVGNNEADNTTGTKYREWFYGSDRQVAWCAIFVSWCANQAGVSTNIIPRTAGVGVMRTGVLNNGGYIVKTPQAGDLVFYKLHSNGSWGHVGLMTGPKTSVQGNIGGRVYHVDRPEYYILKDKTKAYTIEYIRPNYENIKPPEPTVVVTTGTADTITETSAILRGSFTTTLKRATECGMYLGADQNNLTKLGWDNVNTFGTSMFYSTAKYGRTLTPGTTYYYQSYAIVNGSETKGSLESFITKGTPPTPTPAPALGISLSSNSLTLKYGTRNKLSASTTPAALPVTWKSSDESVVTVKDGEVTAIGSGTAYVVAIVYGDKKSASDFCTVTVEAPSGTEPAPVAPVDPDIKLVQSTATLDIGERTILQAITTPADQTIGWNSSNEAVAVVDQSGIVTALAAGTATITACMEYNGDTYFALCGIVVKSTAPDVTLSVSSVTNIAQTTARVNASCAYGTGCRPSSVGLYLGTSPSSLSYWKSDDSITHNKNPFDIWYNLSDLSAGTTYYYQFYAKTDRGEVRSEVNSFTTESSAPTPVSNTRTAIVVNTNGQYLAINDRPAASPRYSNQIGRIPPSGTVTVYTDKTSGNWYYVEYNGVNGYAYSKYLSLR